MKIKLGLYAIPFGFGPVSKAVAIAKAVSKKADVEWHLIGSGISMEFMKREGLSAKLVENSDMDLTEGLQERLSKELDGAVVLMDNDWADRLAPHIPVFFADSLGFMWRKADFEKFPNMNLIERYYVQDLFGAYENMRNTGLRKLKAVSPIIDVESGDSAPSEKRFVVHLGGLFNPFNPATTKVYLEGITSIIEKLDAKSPILLMSQSARTAFPDILSRHDARSLQHKNAVATIGASAFTWSSPGLTTILEMAHMGVLTAPLPPQNYSQALNTRNMVECFGDKLHNVWHFLSHEYREIVPGMPEELGVRKITELNAEKLRRKSFQDEFSALANDARLTGSSLPQDLKFEKSGTCTIADDICDFYTSRPTIANGRVKASHPQSAAGCDV